MSEENVEIVRQLSDAFDAGDWDAALSPYDDGAELDMTRIPAGGVYRGPEGVRQFFGRWIASWDRFEVERLDLIDAGDAVVQISRITGIGKTSGAEVQMRSADVFFIEDGRIVRHVAYPDAAEALADLGLSQ
jgi:uncharacterized protein